MSQILNIKNLGIGCSSLPNSTQKKLLSPAPYLFKFSMRFHDNLIVRIVQFELFMILKINKL